MTPSEITNLIATGMVLLIALAVATPGLLAYRKASQGTDIARMEGEMRALRVEIAELRIKIDNQQRLIGDLTLQSSAQTATYQLQTANLLSIQKMLLANLARLSTQVRNAGQEPAVDIDALNKLLA